MNEEIPHIEFQSGHDQVEGIEIITLENLKQRKEGLNHIPEKAHQLSFYMLVYYTQGETKHLIDFVWHTARKNTLFYLTKGQVNAFKFNERVKGYLILFTEGYFKSQLSKLPENVITRLFTSHLFSPKIQVPEDSNVSHYMKLFYNEFHREKDGFNRANIINALYIVLFSKLEQLKQHQTFHLKESDRLEVFLKFKTLLEQHYTESRNADYYAEKMHITYKHLNSVCKEIVNNTAKQFIDEFIILEAKRKLINSSIKSTQLAFLMGFEESTNFVKYFKKFTGLTPNSFKKQYI